MVLCTPSFSKAIPAIAVLALLATSGCSTVMEGRTQKITVNSSPEGAECIFKQADDVVGSVTTPGTAEVHKTKNDLVLLCSKPGYESVSINNHSDLSLASLGNMVLGNYSFIGNAVDSMSGANNKYDSKVFVALMPAPTPTAFPAPPGAPPIIKLAPTVAAAMSMQVPMPGTPIVPASAVAPLLQVSNTPQIMPELKAVAAPVTSVASMTLPTPLSAAVSNAAIPAVTSGASPSISASVALARAADKIPSPAQLAQRDYVQALAESPRRPPFDVDQ